MKQIYIIIGLGFLVVTSSLPAATLQLIYSGNLDGELEPCGCSEQGNFGGIKRRVTLLDNLRKKFPKLVAISSGGLIRAEGSADRIKSDFILQGFKALKYDAIGVQWSDLVYGDSYLTNTGLPWVATNWLGGRSTEKSHKGIQISKIITRHIADESITIDFFSWLDSKKSPLRSMQGNHTQTHADFNLLSKKLKSAKSKHHITIVSSRYSLEQLSDLLPLQYIDIVFIESAYEEFSAPKKIANTLVLQPGSRGMRIAKLDLQVKQGVILKWQQTVIAMPESMPDSSRMLGWYKDYNAKVKLDYLRLSKLKKRQQAGESPYVGEQACEACHVDQHKRWQSSAHAQAFDDLESVGKSFDPECLVCHTVGFNKPGGFIDFSVTGDLMGVQCESCHGASRAHVKSAGVKAVANKSWPKQKICAQCHTQPHSPGFSLQKYWPKIAH